MYSTIDDVTDAIQSTQKSDVASMKDHNPVILFEKFFDEYVMDLIIENN